MAFPFPFYAPAAEKKKGEELSLSAEKKKEERVGPRFPCPGWRKEKGGKLHAFFSPPRVVKKRGWEPFTGGKGRRVIFLRQPKKKERREPTACGGRKERKRDPFPFLLAGRGGKSQGAPAGKKEKQKGHFVPPRSRGGKKTPKRAAPRKRERRKVSPCSAWPTPKGRKKKKTGSWPLSRWGGKQKELRQQTGNRQQKKKKRKHKRPPPPSETDSKKKKERSFPFIYRRPGKEKKKEKKKGRAPDRRKKGEVTLILTLHGEPPGKEKKRKKGRCNGLSGADQRKRNKKKEDHSSHLS